MTSASVNAQSGSTLRIDPATTSIGVNETFDFSIILDIEPGRNYANGSFTIEYDDSILEINSFDVGSGLFGAANIATSGLIRFNALSISGETGQIVLGSGQFTAIVEGDSILTIGVVDAPGDSSGLALPDLQIVDLSLIHI